MFREFWMPPEPDPLVTMEEWKELWQSFSKIGIVRHLHITIFQVCSIPERTSTFQADDLLLPLQSVRAREFLVEIWGNEERIEEPSAGRPFRFHLNPALGSHGKYN
jgi:hypothetical protein